MPDTWTTRDGRTLSIHGMETDHLKNTVAWIARNAIRLMHRDYLADQFACARALIFVNGEAAKDAIELEMCREFDPDGDDIADWIDRHPARRAMLAELRRREKVST